MNANKVLNTSYTLSGNKLNLKINDEFNDLEKNLTLKKAGNQLIDINDRDYIWYIINDAYVNKSALTKVGSIWFGTDGSNLNHNDNSFQLTETSTSCNLQISIEHKQASIFKLTGTAKNCNDSNNNGSVSGFAHFTPDDEGEGMLAGYLALNNESLSFHSLVNTLTPPEATPYSKLDGLWLHEYITVLHVTENGEPVAKILDYENGKVIDMPYTLSGDTVELKINDEFNNVEAIITLKKEGDKLFDINNKDNFLSINNDINVNKNNLKDVGSLLFGFRCDYESDSCYITDDVNFNHSDDSFTFTETTTLCSLHVSLTHYKASIFKLTGTAENCINPENNGNVNGFASFLPDDEYEGFLFGYVSLNQERLLFQSEASSIVIE